MKYWIKLQVSVHLNTPKAEVVEEIHFWKPLVCKAWYVPVVQFPLLFTKVKLWIKKKKMHHLPTTVIMLGFIPKHVNHWLGILTNRALFSLECVCVYRGPFFLVAHFNISAPLPLPFLSTGRASLSNDPCTLGSSWCPSFARYLFSHFNNWLLNHYLYWVPIFFGHKGHIQAFKDTKKCNTIPALNEILKKKCI